MSAILQQRRHWLACGIAAAAAALSGCASAPSGSQPSAATGLPSSSTAATGSAARTSPLPSAALPLPTQPPDAVGAELDVERQWLLSFFSGTPVEIGLTPEGSLSVVVPAEFCFYPKATVIQPPLAAVLEKVALSLRRQPLTRVTVLSAPADDGSAGARKLAIQRAAAAAKRLRSFGIGAKRLALPTAADGPVLRLLIEASPA